MNRKSKRILTFVLCAILAFGLVAGCSSSSSQQKTQSDTTTPGEETQFFSFPCSQTGTFQYMYVASISGLMKEVHPEYNMTCEASNGTSENIDLVYRGEAAITLASPERLYNAYNGTGKYEDKGKLNCGILWSYMSQATLLFVKDSSDIYGYEDLAGKKVAIGAAGSSNEFKNSYVLEAYGYTRASEDVYEFNELTTFSIDYPEAAQALAEGTIDAIIATQPLPEPSIYELSMTTKLRVYGLDEEIYANFREKYAWMWDTIVPANVYRDQDELITTLGDPNYVWASVDLLSEEDAYNITKAYVEVLLPQLAKQYDQCKAFNDDHRLLTANWVIPGHPGAVKYYNAFGLSTDVIEP